MRGKGMSFLRKTFFGVVGCLMLPSLALAGPNVTFFNVQVMPGKQGEVIEGVQEFMATKTGQNFPGSLHVNAISFNGKSPATHTFVVLHNSRKEAQAWNQSLASSKDWANWMEKLSQISKPVSQTNMDMVKNWGTIDNADRFWDATYFSTSDPGAVVEAMDQLMSTDRFKKFPGQVWLNATAFGGDMIHGTTTHMIAVGYQSMEEFENWNDENQSSAEFTDFLNALVGKVEWLNNELVYNALVFDQQTSLETFGD